MPSRPTGVALVRLLELDVANSREVPRERQFLFCCLGWFYKMERTGLEPVTPCLQRRSVAGSMSAYARRIGVLRS